MTMNNKMPKYINADELIKAIETELWDWKTVDGIKSSTVLKQTISDIKNMPPADVVEVKHGEWVENDNDTYSCSLCQSWIPKEQYYYARYCLHCGADMRGEME